MLLLDWLIVAALLVVLCIAAWHTKRYTRSAGAFLAANRCGGRYLITVSNNIASLGVITLVALFEQNYRIGYTSIWWGLFSEPVLIVLALSGWVVYRFRQTRAMTLAQFFEMRYSRNFRVFAGLVAFLAGIINFGIYPAVGARFFIALCGLPDELTVGAAALPTFPLMMGLLLAMALFFTFAGGQIAVMVTDFIQGVFANVVFIVVIVLLLVVIGWDRMAAVMLDTPPEQSMIHPFHTGAEDDFNPWFFAISAAITFYGVLTWQGTQGYYCCAKNAHEAKMAAILNQWRWRVLLLIAVVVPVAVRAFLHHPDFAAEAAAVESAITAVDNTTLQNQLRSPLVLHAILPVGVLGLLCAAMLAAFISTNDTYLHSWGTMFVQDVILPFRRTPLTPKRHLWALRLSIFGVAVFIFLFSLLFPLGDHILMFFAITGSIFVAGAGSVIIGGLYWKHGTTPAAWAALITGMVVSLATIVFKQAYEERVVERFGLDPDVIPTSQEMTFYAMITCVTVYVLVSLLGPRSQADMDRLLHRGRHHVEGDPSLDRVTTTTWLERLGISREFTGADRIITAITVAWPFVWTLIFVAGCVYNLRVDVPHEWWLGFWHWWTWLILASSAALTVWFSIGGVIDLRYLFHHVRERDAGAEDDGRVG